MMQLDNKYCFVFLDPHVHTQHISQCSKFSSTVIYAVCVHMMCAVYNIIYPMFLYKAHTPEAFCFTGLQVFDFCF